MPITLATIDGPVAPRVAVEAAGDVFGTTLRSGTSAGSVFEIAAGTSTVKTLATFGPNSSANVDGIDPGNITIDAAGNLFGGTAAAAPAIVRPGQLIVLTLRLSNAGNVPVTGLATLAVFH